MCCRDTRADRVGISALPLNNILSLIQELDLRHANLIIDACNSGGVMGDFNRALSPDTIGSAATTGITLLAACAKDQFAAEVDGEGLCTNAVARCIDGTTFVQDLDLALDLTSVSAVVARSLREADQQPTFWGLNLTGRPNFCKNPHFSGDSELRRTLAEAKPMALTSNVAKRLQRIYDELDHGWVPARLQRALMQALSGGGGPISHLGFLHSLAAAMRQRAAQLPDPFREIEITVTCLSPLLEYCREYPSIEHYVVERCLELGHCIVQKCQEIHCELDRDEFALLGDAGLGELFVLPRRITNLLGWLCWAILVNRSASEDAAAAERLAKQLLAGILEKYRGSIRAVSDTQAPALFTLGATLATTEARDELEELVGLYFLDLCDARGMIAGTDLDYSLIVDFLLAKSGDRPDTKNATANPSAFLCVLLVLGAQLELDEAFDSGMSDLDHRNANAFVPETYSHFAHERIERGYNATLQIGNGIWQVADFRDRWKDLERPPADSTGISLLSTACSLVYPDRVAWHLIS